ncbi:hypothetical protein FACS1894164_11070 [Spirochaetia bacterium]|nr:hypothetical protein FACS1894164_11070 [Spirochaetia bacterium]
MINWKYFVPSLKIGLVCLVCALSTGVIAYVITRAIAGEMIGRFVAVGVACVAALIGAFIEAKLLKKIK